MAEVHDIYGKKVSCKAYPDSFYYPDKKASGWTRQDFVGTYELPESFPLATRL